MTTQPFDILDILTPRQREIYVFIRSKIQGRGYGPTVREIGNEFGIKSPNGVVCHLKNLQKKGLIHREANMSRAIQLLQEDTGTKTIECPHCKKMIELPFRIIKSSCS
jgi:SOS-response transcriptional repressor LexA